MFRRETLDVDTALWIEHKNSVTSPRPTAWSCDITHRTGYLSGVLVHCDVDNTVIVVALLQNGLVDGQVPALPDLPEHIDSKAGYDAESHRRKDRHPTGSRERYSHDRVKHVSDLQTRS